MPESIDAGEGLPTWILNQTITKTDFSCTVLTSEEEEQGVSVIVHSNLLDLTDEVELVTVPEGEEVIPLADPLMFEFGSVFYAAQFTVDVGFPSPVEAKFGLSVSPEEGQAGRTVEINCEGSAE